MDLWALLSQYMDGYAVIIAFGITQLIRALLPTPDGAPKILGASFYVSGWGYRMLPFFPLLIASLVVIFKDTWITPTMSWDEALVKGLVSGIAASYVYRTVKIVIFGKDPKDKEEIPKEQTIVEVVKNILG